LARGSFATCSEEHNWYEHFELLMRHPVINAGVQIAAWHHYRLSRGSPQYLIRWEGRVEQGRYDPLESIRCRYHKRL